MVVVHSLKMLTLKILKLESHRSFCLNWLGGLCIEALGFEMRPRWVSGAAEVEDPNVDKPFILSPSSSLLITSSVLF